MDDVGTKMMEAVRAFFDADEWPYSEVSEDQLRTSFGGDHGSWVVTVEVRSAYERLICYSVITESVPAELRPAVAEYITRVNYGMSLGNFEMDYDQGELRYRTSIDVAGESLTPGLVKQVVYGNVLTVDLFVAGARAVIEEGVAPADAIVL